MTEEEKMLAGELYDANYNKELLEKQKIAKNICLEYNYLRYDEEEKRKEVLEKLFQKKLGSITVQPNFYCDYGFNIEVGENFYSNHNLVLLDAGGIKVGNNVWFGGNVCVMPGVTIGDNVVIGAGSVVTKNIPSNTVAAGVPCKVIKET